MATFLWPLRRTSVAAALLLAACAKPAPPADPPGDAPAPAGEPDPTPGFANTVWKVGASSAVEPGTFYVFLSDGTLLIASAHGTPELGRWRYAADTLTLVEEGRAYSAAVLRQEPEALAIRIAGPGDPIDITFVPAAAPAAVNGTVTYRERMALPPDAVVQVQLLDVSRQDAPAPPVAEMTVDPGGRQVPLPFALRYAPVRIDPKHSYAVRATIRSEGRLIFTTTTSTPVITRGNPTTVELMLSRVAAAPDPNGK